MRPSSSEVKEYFAILREYYPNENEPLIDTSTNEPAKTPQPSQVRFFRNSGEFGKKNILDNERTCSFVLRSRGLLSSLASVRA